MERLTEAQAVCEEKVMLLRRHVQSYVGSNIKSTASLFLLNIDTELGLVMMMLNQLGKKRQAAVDQVTEVIKSRSKKRKTPEEDKTREKSSAPKTDDEYIEIIDKLTREMFAYEQDQPHHHIPRLVQSNLTRSESEYERVLKELDDKLKTTSLEISEVEKQGSSKSGGPSKKAKNPSLETIDKLFDPPEKIDIPSRYQPHLDLELEDEARGEARTERSCEIR